MNRVAAKVTKITPRADGNGRDVEFKCDGGRGTHTAEQCMLDDLNVGDDVYVELMPVPPTPMGPVGKPCILQKRAQKT